SMAGRAKGGLRVAAVAGMALALSGCMQSPAILDKFGDGRLGLTSENKDSEVTRRSSNFETVQGEATSETIEILLERPSILERGSSYANVAQAALDASSRAAEADLRAARLRAKAKSKNWLPTIGPSISLTSLGDVVANLLVEQVLFDNGRRKGEREFAAADVEVAAVTLSTDMNTRVETAVALYVTALRGDEKANLNERALSQMYEFERIVNGRVQGGISDRSDLRVVESKINDITSAKTSAQEAARTARAELRAMTGEDFAGVFEPLRLDRPPVALRPLAVLLAEAEGRRDVAQSKIDRAGLLPSVTASANVSDGGTDAAIGGGGAALGFGTPAALRAIEAAQDAAARQVSEAEEDARRRYSRQEQRLASFKRQEGEAAALAQESRVTFKLFQAQFKAGARSVMDVVSIYEEMVQREQAHVDAKYEVILIHLEMARDQGLLAEGEAI
ncbi:MAG: TolC family protein, partial [Pseudomonadota bacterium]